MGPSYETVMRNLSYCKPQRIETPICMGNIRDAAQEFAKAIFGNCIDPSPERSIALRHVEEACMYAIAHLARSEYPVF